MSNEEIAVHLTSALVTGALKDSIGKREMDELQRARTATNTVALYQHLKGLLDQNEPRRSDESRQVPIVKGSKVRMR